ncbi:tryptophan synthase subunit alpha [Candidatus Vidania fulgoroideorum]
MIGIIPFLIPFFPNEIKFLKILSFFIKNSISTFEVGIPDLNCYGDGEVISDIYRRINFNLNKTIKIFKRFKLKVNSCIIIVCYSNFLSIKIFKKFSNLFSAILIIDKPLGYILKLNNTFIKYNLKFIYIISTNNMYYIEKNLKKIKKKECLFIYLTTRAGITGNGKINFILLKKKFIFIKKKSKFPIIIGFSINNFIVNKISIFKRYIIGSYLMKLLYNKKLVFFKKFLKKYNEQNKIKKYKKNWTIQNNLYRFKKNK